MAVGGIQKITPPRKAGGIPWVSTRFGLRVENEWADAGRHGGANFHTETLNTKTLTRVNIRLSRIALNISRDYNKNTLILRREEINQLKFWSRACVKKYAGDSSISQPPPSPFILGNDCHPYP